MATAATVADGGEAGTTRGHLGALALGALGVVYGDLGTSPLYTMKTALDWAGGATPAIAVGMRSLIIWTLVITTSLKYVAVVMRADNDGEGGILALMSLLGIKHGGRVGIIAIGILGAALLYGDGAITPAISVLSALEGLRFPALPLANFIAQVRKRDRVPGTAVYLTSRVDVVPVPLLHNLKHNKVLHGRIVLLHVVTENIPRVAPERRIDVVHLGGNFHSVVARYGFMEQPNVPRALEECRAHQLVFDMMDTSFFVGRVTVVARKFTRLDAIRYRLFEAMHRNALAATEFFRIPPNRVVELGGQVEI
jgi:K+ transporter